MKSILYLVAIGMAHNIPPNILDVIDGSGLDVSSSHPTFQLKGGEGRSPKLSNPPNEDYQTQVSNFVFIFLISLISVSSIFVISFLTYYFIKRRIRLSEDEILREEENQAYLELNQEEQELYFQSKEYLQDNPSIKGDLSLSQNLLIQEKGIKAWEFLKDTMLTNNDLLILNKYELNFFKKFECSSQTNLPIPNKNEVYYFECKIYSLPNPEETKISIGIGCKPYPWFRLPGRHAHSVSYDSDGYRRHNQPFKFKSDPPFPVLTQGDVIGIGFRVRSGTIFFTRNGKKVSESKIGGHIKNFRIPHGGQIFPIIGANNLCSIHVNLGQMGYVFIEGNVKKWGFAPLEGTGPAPPIYNKFNTDILLERSEIDDENDLTDRENDFPPDFWDIHGNGESEDDVGRSNRGSGPDGDSDFDHDKFSYNAYSEVNSNDERITLNTLAAPERPPSYDGENNEEGDDRDEQQNGDDNHDPENIQENTREQDEIQEENGIPTQEESRESSQTPVEGVSSSSNSDTEEAVEGNSASLERSEAAHSEEADGEDTNNEA